jgi:hypothetical protein
MHLRHAAQAIGVLHARIIVAMRLAYITVGEELAEMRSRCDLSGVGRAS